MWLLLSIGVVVFLNQLIIGSRQIGTQETGRSAGKAFGSHMCICVILFFSTPPPPSPPISLSLSLSHADGAPKLGWHDTIAYLTIPVILILTQSVSMKINQPARDPNVPLDEAQQASQNVRHAVVWNLQLERNCHCVICPSNLCVCTGSS